MSNALEDRVRQVAEAWRKLPDEVRARMAGDAELADLYWACGQLYGRVAAEDRQRA